MRLVFVLLLALLLLTSVHATELFSPCLIGTPVLIEKRNSDPLKGRIVLTTMREFDVHDGWEGPPGAQKRTTRKEWELYCLVELDDGTFKWYAVTNLKVDKKRREAEQQQIVPGVVH